MWEIIKKESWYKDGDRYGNLTHTFVGVPGKKYFQVSGAPKGSPLDWCEVEELCVEDIRELQAQFPAGVTAAELMQRQDKIAEAEGYFRVKVGGVFVRFTSDWVDFRLW